MKPEQPNDTAVADERAFEDKAVLEDDIVVADEAALDDCPAIEDTRIFEGRESGDRLAGEFGLPLRSNRPRKSRRRSRRKWRIKKTLASVAFVIVLIIMAAGLSSPERLDDCDGHFDFDPDSPCAEPVSDIWDWL